MGTKTKITCTAYDKAGEVVAKHEFPSNPKTQRGADRILKQRLNDFEVYYRPYDPTAIEFEARWDD